MAKNKDKVKDEKPKDEKQKVENKKEINLDQVPGKYKKFININEEK